MGIPGGRRLTADKHEERISHEDIARHQLQYLRDHPGACADLSIHVGHHPLVRWDGDQFEVAERMDYGEIEVQYFAEDALVTMFADNPVNIRPLEDATGLGSDDRTIWERVEENGEKVEVLG